MAKNPIKQLYRRGENLPMIKKTSTRLQATGAVPPTQRGAAKAKALAPALGTSKMGTGMSRGKKVR